jgi:alkylhydroperoxidase family enzyme
MRSPLVLAVLAAGMLAALPLNAADGPIARVPVEANPADPDARALLDTYRARGQPINLNLVSAISPKLAKARGELTRAIRYESVVPRPLRELTILRTAQLMGGEYEMHQHSVAALACGFSQAQLDALAHWSTGELFSEKQRALLAYLDEAIGRKGEVSDKTFAELSRQFSTREIVEVTMIAAQYMGTSMFTNALRVRIDGTGTLSAIVLGPC